MLISNPEPPRRATLEERVLGLAPCAVYRCFDDRGVLLYVGMTNNPRRREREHRSGAGFGLWSQWARVMRVQWFEDREAAAAAEVQAINEERPVFNEQRRIDSLHDRLGCLVSYLESRRS